MSNQRHEWFTNNLISAIAVAVAAIGLVVSSWQTACTYKEMRHFNSLSVHPHLDILMHQYGDWSMINNGIGPAIVSSLTAYLDGEPLPANFEWWKEVRARVPEYKDSEHLITPGRLRKGQYVRSGEEVYLLQVDHAYENIRYLVNRIEFVVKYESVYGEPFVTERVQRGIASE